MAALQTLAILLLAVAMALSLAHALELPGKLRLSEEQYRAVQPIYYPGFTLGGLAEPLGFLVVLALLFLTPGGAPFWLTLGALLALAAMHAAYWLLTHPVNNFWLKEAPLRRGGAGFFAFDPLARGAGAEPPDWRRLRNRWEGSHVLRALLGFLGLALLTLAVVLD